MSEDKTLATAAIALVGGLAMLAGFLVLGPLAVAIAGIVVVLWAGFALGPSRSVYTLVWSLVAAALVYGVLALGDVVIGTEERSNPDAGALARARSEVREERDRAERAAKRADDSARDIATARGRLRSSRREADRLRRDVRVLRRALRRVASR